jgi:hypothetical protein
MKKNRSVRRVHFHTKGWNDGEGWINLKKHDILQDTRHTLHSLLKAVSPRNENFNLLVGIKFLNLFCIYSLTCLTGHLFLTVTLRPAQLILLYNLTLFNGYLSNAANGHLIHAWIVRSSSNNGHFGHLIT